MESHCFRVCLLNVTGALHVSCVMWYVVCVMWWSFWNIGRFCYRNVTGIALTCFSMDVLPIDVSACEVFGTVV